MSLLNWWQHLPENINPVFLQLGPLQIRYYGLMYMTSFLVVYFLLLHRIKKERTLYSRDVVEDYLFWAIVGVVLGSRLGYVLFYDLFYFLDHPWQILLPVDPSKNFQFTGISGMSYHGGLIGIMLATLLFCYRYKQTFWPFVDFLVSAVPLGYAFGRLGNFLNGELYGRVTTMPWGMYFTDAPTHELRHPSQLYEMFFEGFFLFFVLSIVRSKKFPSGSLFAIYLIGYGLVRFVIEFFRQPDEHLGFVFLKFSMGQLFCFAMIFVGAILLYLRLIRPAK